MMFILSSITALGQQDPMFTQYMFNQQVINPAYAGTWENMGFLVMGRHQWAGMDGAPHTYTFSAQSPVKNEKIALGLNVISDQAGKEKRMSVFGDYSYRLRVNEKTWFRMGLKFGFSHYSHNLSLHQLYPGTNDPLFMGDIGHRFMPNFGIGTFLYGEKFYLGLSAPKLVHNEMSNDYNNYSTVAEWRHYFLTGGYVFDLGTYLKFKPTFMLKAVKNAPLSYDLTGNFLLGEKFWLGGMYRSGDSFGFIAQWIIDKQLRLGYAMDFTLSKLQNYQNGTHELMISYELSSLRRKWTSPRYF